MQCAIPPQYGDMAQNLLIYSAVESAKLGDELLLGGNSLGRKTSALAVGVAVPVKIFVQRLYALLAALCHKSCGIFVRTRLHRELCFYV